MTAPARELFGITHGSAPTGEPCRVGGGIRPARATYDAADTNPTNRRHWANADGLSVKAANNHEVRRKLRNRARLEFDNGGNCKGAIETVGHDLVGTGPRLRLALPDGSHPDAAATIERLFAAWCDDPAVTLSEKLRVMVESELRDGESFALFVNNPAVAGLVKLDVRVVEADQVSTPLFNPLDPKAVDGIEFDDAGNPTFYHLLKQHPGDLAFMGMAVAGMSTRVPASQVIHWFRASRAGHQRGIPRITPGLPLIAQIRGYSSATLAAARLQAQYAGFVQTTLAPEAGPAEVAAYDPIPVEDGGVLTLPAGWGWEQATPTQPGTNFAGFREANLTEFGRSIHAPRNVVTGDSSGYNFSSARLDFLMYRGAIRVDRNRLAVRGLDRIFVAWLGEAVLVRGHIPDAILAALPPVEAWGWAWQYDGFPSINPVDDATADETNLKNGLVTHGELLAERGVHWRDHFKAIADQRDYAQELGIEDLLYPWLIKPTPTAVAPPGISRTNEGGRGKPQDGPPKARHGAEYQAEVDTVLEEEGAPVA